MSEEPITEMRDGVEITYPYAVADDQQDSAFHTWGTTTTLAVVTYEDRELLVQCVGEMRLAIPLFADAEETEWVDTEIVRYTDKLIEMGIDTDQKLFELSDKYGDYDIWHNNSWYEIYSLDNDDFGYEVQHEFKEAVDSAVALIKQDEYWNKCSECKLSESGLCDDCYHANSCEPESWGEIMVEREING